jgi:hypothetical protein
MLLLRFIVPQVNLLINLRVYFTHFQLIGVLLRENRMKTLMNLLDEQLPRLLLESD